MELLLPAGSPEAFYAALEGGADAVYLGLDRFNARGRAKNFSRKQFLAAIGIAHSKGARVYLTLNTLVKNEELPDVIELLSFVAATEADAVIVQDWGVFYTIKKYFPDLAVHASTQMAVHNSAGVYTAGELGFACAVLARELTLPEIAAAARAAGEASRGHVDEKHAAMHRNGKLQNEISIHSKKNIFNPAVKPVRIEVFAHGALCYSISGHCLFSSWVGGMSANRGLCRQACRRNYTLRAGEHPEPENARPLFNLRDLELVDHLAALQKAGVDALKIEGRMKPAEYVSRVAGAYRLALRSANAMPERSPEEPRAPHNEQQPQSAKEILQSDYAREKTSYFAGGSIKDALTDRSFTGKVLGRVSKITARGFTLRLECALAKSGRLRIQASSGEDSPAFGIDALLCGGLSAERAEAGQDVEILPRGEAQISTGGARAHNEAQISFPRADNAGSTERTLRTKPMAQPGDLVLLAGTKETRFPSRLPIADIAFPKRMPLTAQKKIHEEIMRSVRGMCAMHTAHSVRWQSARPEAERQPRDELIMRIDSLAWLAKVQPEKLDALILQFTLRDWEEFDLLRPGVLRNTSRFVVQLPLFIPEKALSSWRAVLARVYRAGFRTFMASQVWQLPLFDDFNDIELWAAETIYCLNDAAALFLDGLGFERRVLPCENDMQNLYESRERAGVIPLYARPKLFISRVPCMRRGDIAADRTGEYRADIRDGILELTPLIPMSWFQYRFALEDMGYHRFLIDLSAEKPSQNTFRRMLRHYDQGESVQPSSAFNYKEGLS